MTVVGGLCSQATLEARVASGETPDWVVNHWRSFRDALTGDRDGESFPCFFGADSVASGDPLYTAVPSTTDPDALLTLGETLLTYLESWRDHSRRASLVTFFRPTPRLQREADYHETLWHLLQVLHVHDPEPWPESIPTDPDDPYWEFCFGGEPVFPTCRAPFYDDRASRHCPVGLEITFQPRALFEAMNVTGDTDRGEQVRETIRDRAERYDGVCPHADLGDWGVEGDRDWKQYLLSADDCQAPDQPPIQITREHPKASQLCEPAPRPR